MKLVAKTRIKFGNAAQAGRLGGSDVIGVIHETRGVFVEAVPGETFDADDDRAKELIESGAAIAESEANREKFELLSYEEKLRTIAAEAAANGVDVASTLGLGGPGNKTAVVEAKAHAEKQAEETRLVEEAQKREKSGKHGRASADDDDDEKKAGGSGKDVKAGAGNKK